MPELRTTVYCSRRLPSPCSRCQRDGGNRHSGPRRPHIPGSACVDLVPITTISGLDQGMSGRQLVSARGIFEEAGHRISIEE